uniref:Putative LOV domain-containing protein n=1 Tax=Gloeochaete wittrockiana TaxID=38269 RepID=A0A126X128_9EUKA|nr:putative LOV domain-containing protein [Gloeochaete wittrockiana]|mmetsp:Transcript_11745/g.19101  ORF Transcript_11745/g.19101 Transcript_11745/m.19101 type:complete len:572 (+) Transcript_11745:135-1850(+)
MDLEFFPGCYFFDEDEALKKESFDLDFESGSGLSKDSAPRRTTWRERAGNGAEKGTHSETERKRRDLMNEKIAQLKDLVPGFEQSKPNKVTVLGKAVDYMTELKNNNQKLQHDLEDLRAQITKFKKLSISRRRDTYEEEDEVSSLSSVGSGGGGNDGRNKRAANLFDIPAAMEIIPRHSDTHDAGPLQSLPDLNLKQFIAAALRIAMENLIITDPNIVGHPIVFASPGFQRMTGYTEKEIVGRNCRFLQGSGTDRVITMEIGRAIRDKREYLAEILNYRKDGTPFWNLVYINPVVGANGRTIVFVGVQFDITAARTSPDRAIQVHTMQNMNVKEVEEAVAPSAPRRFVVPSSQGTKRQRIDHSSTNGFAPAPVPAPIQLPTSSITITNISSPTTSEPSSPDTPSCSALALTEPIGPPSPISQPSQELKDFLASVLHMSMQALVVVDGKGVPDVGVGGRGTLLHVSTGFCQMTGFNREDVLGHRYSSLLAGPQTDPARTRMIDAALDNVRPCSVLTEILHYRKDGTSFWNLVSITGVPDTHGEAALWLILNFDVTSHSYSSGMPLLNSRTVY